MHKHVDLRGTVSLTANQERTWIQCLYRKDDQWVPEPGDEDFEIAAKHCFVTGTSKEGVSEFDAEGFHPVKHSVQNCKMNNVEEDPVSVPQTNIKLWKIPSLQ